MSIYDLLKKLGVGSLVGVAMMLAPSFGSEPDARVEAIQGQLGGTISEQNQSIVELLIGSRVPRPQMGEISEGARQSVAAFQHDFGALQEFFNQKVLPGTFPDGELTLKQWFRDNMMEDLDASEDSPNLYARYNQIVAQFGDLKTVLFTGNLQEIQESIANNLDSKNNEGLVSCITKFMAVIDPGEAQEPQGGVYACINKLSNDNVIDAVSVSHISQYLFLKLYSSAREVRYQLECLDGKIQEVIASVTDQTFMDNILERVNGLSSQLSDLEHRLSKVERFFTILPL